MGHGSALLRFRRSLYRWTGSLSYGLRGSAAATVAQGAPQVAAPPSCDFGHGMHSGHWASCTSLWWKSVWYCNC
ncbi:hypothetical protein BU23DRAFT_17799 [Bimuria novae-zelandiae CBS 107.79]|uniref:Uncharacterized protein n=1 Tax=Bimuria novae-zelandiae CBS 107.79 TaxID=1447943 RepID=A0A6A5UM62_9PLEO|nr:hypothetical protein BU23DRAFT_17799 [Bimuria novae-zelandiae CBS 107.79]